MSSRRLVQSLVTVILLAPLFRGVLFKFIGHRAAWADIATRIWPPCRADAVALGVLLAILWHSPELRQWLHNHLPLFVCGMFAGSAVAMVLEYMARANFAYCRFLHASIGRSAVELASFCLIVYLICRPLSVFARFFSTNLMRELGKISYCLYVIHWGILWMIFRFVLHTRFGERLWLDFTVAPVALLLSIAIARLSWKYFEYPLLQRAHGAPRQISVRPIPERQPQIA
jgi:peptidoglycan/LPS O-acetylase OafA/YrhL